MSEQWYWCLDHSRVEQGAGCPNDRRLGPYETEHEAAGALTRARARTEEIDRREEADDAWGTGWSKDDDAPPP